MAGWKGDRNKPLVSILCITYNHAPYIADALNGFLIQETDFPFEIIVHDDASADETQRIIEQYQQRYPNLITTVFQTENQYSKGSRPTQFVKDLCRGIYSALCEGDDYWLSPDKLSKQVFLLETNKDVHLSVHPAYLFDVSKGKFAPKFEHDLVSGSVLPVSDAVSASSQFAPTASYFFRTKEFLSMPEWFFNAQDLPFGDYFIEALLGRHGIIYAHDIFSVYRRNVPGSYTHRTAQSSDNYLISRIGSVLRYTSKLEDYECISSISIQKRKVNIVKDYQGMALARRSLYLYRAVSAEGERYAVRNAVVENIAMKSEVSFRCYRFYRFLKATSSKLKSFIWMLKKRFSRSPNFSG